MEGEEAPVGIHLACLAACECKIVPTDVPKSTIGPSLSLPPSLSPLSAGLH